MSNQNPRLTRRDAERLLDDPAAITSALGTALSAAASPARPGELRREDAEVAAFHTARLTPSPTTRSNFVSPNTLGKRAATRAFVATAAVVALTTGGIALANSAHLPTLPGQASDQATESVSKVQTSEAETETTATESPSATETTETQAPESESASATPTPNLEGLCKAYQANDKSAHGKALDSAAFTALATAATAAGAADVATYCVALIGEPQETGRPTDKPTPGKPTTTPTGKPSVLPTPTDQPTGKPTDQPTGKPTDQPTDQPTGKPTEKPGKGGTTTSG